MIDLKSLNRAELLGLLAILAFSDGYVEKRNGKGRTLRLVTSPEGSSQHDFFRELSYELFQKSTVTREIVRNGKMFILSDLNSTKFVPLLFEISPTYKTTPGNQSCEDYLNGFQPSLGYFLSSSKKLQWLAIRLYFDFDGSISPSYRLKRKKDVKRGRVYFYYQVQFECEINIAETNPNLIRDLSRLCKNLGLKATVKKDKKNWSGYSGIRITEKKSVLSFLNNGGPITSVQVSGKSPRFKGKEKKLICEESFKLLNFGELSRSFKDYYQAERYRDERRQLLAHNI